jgi:RNA polymerase primary sigma factor
LDRFLPAALSSKHEHHRSHLLISITNQASRLTDGLSDYLRLLGRIPLLSPAEELHLGGIVQQWLSHPNPPTALRRRGVRARNRMVSANLRLVVLICRRYRNQIGHLQLELLDLLQAGNLGLIRAVEKFDPTRGYRFSTYGCWWIRQSVRRYMNSLGSSIRIPIQMRSLAYRAKLLQAGSDAALSTHAMAESLGEEPRRIETSLRALALCRPVSLDHPVGNPGEETCLLDLIHDERILSPADDYRWLHQHVQGLEAPEQQVISLRYGSDEQRSLSGVARIMGLTKSEVQSLERRALRKLRNELTPVVGPPVLATRSD